MTDITDFFDDSYGHHYVIYMGEKDYSTYNLSQDGFTFKNLYTYLYPNGSVHKDIVLHQNGLLEERIEDNRCECCYSNYYTLDEDSIIFSDTKDTVELKVTSTEGEHSEESILVRINKIRQ